MFENLSMSLQVVLPIFFQMMIGWFARRKGLVDQPLVDKNNKLLFNIFLPAMVFYQIYTMDLRQASNPLLLGYTAGALMVVTALAFVLVPRFETDRRRAGSVVQGLFRGNLIVYGLVVSQAVYGDRSVGLSLLLVSVCNPFCNIMGVVCFDVFGEGKLDLKKMGLDIIRTPCIVASLSAIALNLMQIPLPELLVSTCNTVGKVSSPLALILIGATFSTAGFIRYKKEIFWVNLLKLFVIPFAVIGLAALLGFRNAELVAVFAIISCPLAISSYPVASAMGGDGDLAAQLLISTSLLSVISIFTHVLTMKTFGLI